MHMPIDMLSGYVICITSNYMWVYVLPFRTARVGNIPTVCVASLLVLHDLLLLSCNPCALFCLISLHAIGVHHLTLRPLDVIPVTVSHSRIPQLRARSTNLTMADHEAGKKLKLYVHMGSQPARAVTIFCRANKIEAEEIKVDLFKQETRTPEYKKLNPMGVVPCIDDDGFKLYESHAILRYLATTRNVADHWYPEDPKQRALVDAALDWHHLNLRRYSTQLVQNGVLVKLPAHAGFVTVGDYDALAADAVKTLPRVFDQLETMLQHGTFLQNVEQVSIADLSLACELMQIQGLCSVEDRQSLLGSRERLKKWMTDVEQVLRPHFSDVHQVIRAYGKHIDELRASGDL